MSKHLTILVRASLAALLGFLAPLSVARADIFQWEYINPADPSQGKQPSTTLAPGGMGVSAVPGANLSNRNLTMAYLIGADLSATVDQNNMSLRSDLTGTNLTQADLTNADLVWAVLTNATFTQAELVNSKLFLATMTNANFSRANLSNAEFRGASLVNANFSQANLTNADFDGTTSPYFSAPEADLTGANLSDANLTNANFRDVPLGGANLTGAEVRGAIFSRNTTDPNTLTGITVAQLSATASYQSHDLTGIKLQYNLLAGVNLAGQNLTNASFFAADLTGANLTGAEIRGGNFQCRFTADQLYSTASYQADQLSGISLWYLPGVILSGQDLTYASFIGDFAGADFSQSNLAYSSFQTPYGGTLANVDFSNTNLTGARIQADVTGANFSGAEVRGIALAYSTGFIAAQLYSTASYQGKNLIGIGFQGHNLAGVNFANQNLTNAAFLASDLTGANLSQANLSNASFSGTTLTNANFSHANLTNATWGLTNLTGANLSGANLTYARFYDTTFTGSNMNGADARGAQSLELPSTAITANLIHPDGVITGLNLAAGETLVAAAGVPIPVVIENEFSIAPTARFDLTDNAVIIDYTGNSPVDAVRAAILSGRSGPGLGADWTGPGITSSAAAAANKTQPESRSIGYAENSFLPLGELTEFHGAPVDSTSVLIAFTRTGDANLDSVVGDDDVTIVGASYAPGVANANWAMGDFDYNGFVDDDDVTLLGAFYDPSAPQIATPGAAVTAVPEPSTATMLALASVALALAAIRQLQAR